MSNESFPKHTESFEVVLLKDGASQMSASVSDFQRVAVEAESPLQAQMSDEAKKDGWTAIYATKPGLLTEPEVLARRRELDPEAPADAFQWRPGEPRK